MQSRGNNNVPGFDCNSQRSVNIIHGLIEDGILSSRSDSSCSHMALGRSSIALDAGLRWIHLCYGRHFVQSIIMAVHQTGVQTRSTPHCAISRVIAGVFACTAIHNYSVFSNTSQSRGISASLGRASGHGIGSLRKTIKDVEESRQTSNCGRSIRE